MLWRRKEARRLPSRSMRWRIRIRWWGRTPHTPMINGLGVLGWGVGGIEAEAAMLGQPVSMLVPQVVGFRLSGKLKEGTTATDLVLTVTEALRTLGVVGKFVEFYGPGIAELTLAYRATIANMAPEYGATCGIFPVDAETLRYLRLTGRSDEQIALVEAYYREQGMFHTADAAEAAYSAKDFAGSGDGGAERGRAEAAARIGCCCRRLGRASRNNCQRCWGRMPVRRRFGSWCAGRERVGMLRRLETLQARLERLRLWWKRHRLPSRRWTMSVVGWRRWRPRRFRFGADLGSIQTGTWTMGRL